jgi:acetoin utilization protein AcuB
MALMPPHELPLAGRAADAAPRGTPIVTQPGRERRLPTPLPRAVRFFLPRRAHVPDRGLAKHEERIAMKVSQYMTRRVITIGPDTEFHRAFDLMRSRSIHHLPVVEGDRVVGIVAERDLLLAAANFGSAEVPVGEIMRGPPVCVRESAQLKVAARLLVTHHIGSLPVLGTGKLLVGIITETDIFKITAGMLFARPETKKPAKTAAGRIPAGTGTKAVKTAPSRKRKTARKSATRTGAKAK